jgi:hypothetical protein
MKNTIHVFANKSIVDQSYCQYKDVPVWSVTVGRPGHLLKDRVTYLLKIRYNKLK